MPDSPAPHVHDLLAHGDWVHALARRLVRDPSSADDLAQDALVVALERPPAHAANLRAWLGRVLRNLHRERARRQPPTLAASPAPHDDSDPSVVVERAETLHLVVEEVLALAEPYRTTLLLRYFDELAPAAIAAREGLPLATVTSRLTRAHAQLRERLDRRHGGDGRTWALALGPLLAARTGAPPLTTLAGALSMSTLAKTLIGLALLTLGLVFGGRLFFQGDARDQGAASIANAQRPATLANDAPAPGEQAAAPAPDAAGARTPVARQAPAPAPPVQLGGIVLTPDGAPATNAFVLLGELRPLAALEDGDEPADDVVWTRVDAEGRFGFNDLAPGKRVVTAGAPGLASSASVALELGADETRTDLELTLRVGARLTGEVLRPDGLPAVEREVRLLQTAQAQEALGLRMLRYVTTDAFGHFESPPLRPGTWGVLTYPSGDELAELGVEQTEVMLQATVELQDGGAEHVRLGVPSAQAVRVSGQVTAGGEPVAGALLQWMAESAGTGPEHDPMASQVVGTADDEGRFTVELGAPGAWWVRAMGGGLDEDFFVDVPAVAEHALDLALPTGEVRGRVRDASGAPLAGVSVSHLIVSGRPYGSPLSLAVDRTLTDAEGAFALRGLGPGVYQIGAVGLTAGIAPVAVVEVGANEVVAGLELEVAGGARIAGLVRGVDGLPAGGATVWIHDADGRVVNPISQLRTNDQGRFRTPPLPAGEYALIAHAGTAVAQHTGLVHMDAGQDLELTLEPGGALVVELRAADGATLRGQVRVHDQDGRLMTGLRDYRDPWSWRRYPFDSRRKHVGPLPTGSYRVSVEVPGVGSATREVAVASGEALELRFDL